MKKIQYWTLYRAAFKRTALTEEEIAVIRALYQEEGREKVYSHAERKKIIPAVAFLLSELNLEPDYWKPISDSFRERNERVVTYLNAFYEALEKSGVTGIAVTENFGALLHAEANLALFGSGDSDNYANLAERDNIVKALEASGYSLKDKFSGKILISTQITREDTDREHYYFGINWDVTTRTKLPCITSKSDFMDWEACTCYKDTHIRIPSAEALMYICLLHISVHGFCKTPDIRLYVDIANAASKPLDWMKIVQWAKNDGNCLRVAVATTLAHRMLDVEIPEEVMKLGNPRRRERLISQVSIPEENALKDFPGKFKIFMIDIYSCDGGVLDGIKYVFFPPKAWIKAKYGSVLLGRLKHFSGLI